MIVEVYNALLIVWIILFLYNLERPKPFGFIIHAVLSFILAINGSYLEIFSLDLATSKILSYPYLTWFFFGILIIDVVFAFYYFFKPAEEVARELDRILIRKQ